MIIKSLKPLALLALPLAMSATLNAQTTTDPVGVVRLGDTAGTNAVAAHSEVTISIPVLHPSVFAGTIASANGNVITMNEAMVAGAYDNPNPGTPYMIEIASGTDNGMYVPIISNTETTITVALGGGDDLTNLVADDKLRVRLAWTLKTMLPTGIPDNAKLLVYDDQPGINNSSSLVNISFAGVWYDGATFDVSDDMVVYPGESYVLVNGTATPIASLVMSGHVPTSNSRVRIAKDGAGAQDTRFSYVSPVDQIVGNAGFVPTDNDKILFFDNSAVGLNKSPTTLIAYDGLWYDGATFDEVTNTFKLKGGQGYIYRQAPAAPVGIQVISDEQDYIQGL